MRIVVTVGAGTMGWVSIGPMGHRRTVTLEAGVRRTAAWMREAYGL